MFNADRFPVRPGMTWRNRPGMTGTPTFMKRKPGPWNHSKTGAVSIISYTKLFQAVYPC